MGAVAADYLGIPRIVSHPMFPIVSPEHIASDEELDRVRPDPTEVQAEFRARWLSIARRWGVELGHGGEAIHTPAETMFAYTTPEIVGESQLDPAWRLIGPLMSPIPRSDLGDRPLVYVCFGTSFNKRMQQFTSVIEALADEPVDVLISTGKSTITASDLGPLPANIVVQEFVEAREVLSRASAHITHGGCNSIHESLLAGVPMLCIPQAYDQFPLAGRMSVLGAGRTSARTHGRSEPAFAGWLWTRCRGRGPSTFAISYWRTTASAEWPKPSTACSPAVRSCTANRRLAAQPLTGGSLLSR